MGLFDKGSSTTNTTGGQQPWAPTIPGLTLGINAATNAFKTGAGSQPYMGNQVVPFSQYSTGAFGNMNALANKFQPGLTQAAQGVASLAGQGGLNTLQDQQVARLNQIAGGTGLNAIQTQAAGYLNPIAAGKQLGQSNPYLNEIIRRSSNDIIGVENLAASAAGRYGSGGHQAATQKAIGDMAVPLRFADYNTQQQRQDAAIKDYFGMGTTGFDQRGDAIGALANLGQQQWTNIAGLPTAMGNAYQQALAPSQTRQQIGQQYEDLYRRTLDDRERIFRETQAQPWQNINNLNAALGGGPALANYGTNYGTSTQPTQSMGGKIIGGGIAGASMFGGNPWGIAAGAALGALQ